MADIRDAVTGASGGVAAVHAPPLDPAKYLAGLTLSASVETVWDTMRQLLSDRSQVLPQVLENRILTAVAISAADQRRPH